ncbi:MAG: hypothetical protein ACPGYV_09425 [Phycisphaeraceae bacterium]
MPATLDDLMETASRALAELDYTRCEALCDDALTRAREAEDWVMYQRVLLPLQEARRQKRQAALDGAIRLGVRQRPADMNELVPEGGAGCLVLTHCCDALDATNILSAASASFELLYADNAIEAETWTIVSVRNAVYTVEMPAPAGPLQDLWLASGADQLDAAHYFMQASEALGDAALASVGSTPGTLQHLLDLEHALDAAGDHELLHQALAAAAKALHEARR